MASGSIYDVTANRSPTSITYAGFTQVHLNPTSVTQDQYFASPAVAAPAGDVTVCAVGTKAELDTVDWISFSDHAGTYSLLAEDNGVSITMYGLSSGQAVPSPSQFEESMVCLKFDATAKKGYVCVFNSDAIQSGCNFVSVTNDNLTGTLQWIIGGAANGTAYNMGGFIRGAFLTPSVVSDAQLAGIAAAALVVSPPQGWTLWQDATATTSSGNSGLAHDVAVVSWKSHGPALSDFAAVSDAGTPHLSLSGTESAVVFDGVYDQITSPGSGPSLAFMHQTGVFDLALVVRRRGTSIDGIERRIFGTAEGQAGFFLGFNGYGNTEGSFWTIIGNGGSPLVVNHRSALVAPLGVPYLVLVRGDGSSLKLSHDFTSFETVSFAASPGGGDPAYDSSFGAIGADDDFGVQFFEGDVLQAIVYPANLDSSRLAELKVFLDRQIHGSITPRTWAALGDSITEGATADYPWPARVTSLLRPSVALANQGKSGDTISGATTRYANSINGEGYYGLVLMIGLNDLQIGSSASSVFTAISSLVTTAKNDGLLVVLCTLAPNAGYSGWDAAKQTQWTSLNSSIRGVSGVTLLDAAVLLADPNDATKLNPAYDYGDQRHLNDAGAAAMAAAVRTLIGGL